MIDEIVQSLSPSCPDTLRTGLQSPMCLLLLYHRLYRWCFGRLDTGYSHDGRFSTRFGWNGSWSRWTAEFGSGIVDGYGE
jgi:hypothetical protein